jgi:DNA-directed RNA polymerase specialized sigma24 family protein
VTAEKLNNLYEAYQGKPSQDSLANVLMAALKFASRKFSRDSDREDIASEVSMVVWRSIDPSCQSPLKPFDVTKSSFSTWLSNVCVKQRENYKRNQEHHVDYIGDTVDLDRLVNAQQCGGGWRNGAYPSENYYYEGPDYED